jgi:hypothetical protein
VNAGGGADLRPERIAALHERIRRQEKDIYTFLMEEFPDIAVEERLRYLAAILNDFFDDYTFDPNDELRHEGYVIKRFFPAASPNSH